MIETNMACQQITPHSTLFETVPGYGRIKVAGSFDDLITARFCDGVNALCWRRTLPGDFGEIVKRLDCGKGICAIEDPQLLALPLSESGRIARDILIADQQLLRAHNLAPALNWIDGCASEMDGGPIARDVMSFHVDSATVEVDTYLCTYFGLPSEGLRNDEALRHVDIPETRAKLLGIYGGKDDEGFREYLNENYYDLHYAPMPNACPFSFGLGNLWRIATAHPGSAVPPCIHRAPVSIPGQSPRLLLIS